MRLADGRTTNAIGGAQGGSLAVAQRFVVD
jgi:hypothetical protein